MLESAERNELFTVNFVFEQRIKNESRVELNRPLYDCQAFRYCSVSYQISLDPLNSNSRYIHPILSDRFQPDCLKINFSSVLLNESVDLSCFGGYSNYRVHLRQPHIHELLSDITGFHLALITITRNNIRQQTVLLFFQTTFLPYFETYFEMLFSVHQTAS